MTRADNVLGIYNLLLDRQVRPGERGELLAVGDREARDDQVHQILLQVGDALVSSSANPRQRDDRLR